MAKTYGKRWEVLQSLGEGGQAHTFLVKDIRGESETQYVLKRLKNLSRIDRFRGEIEAIRNVTHENIVRLIDFDLENKKPYLVTEYCAGGSLTSSKPFWQDSPAMAFELFQQICDGVAFAHGRGVIHRDLKPDNIFLRSEKGPAVVGDFGICFIEDNGLRVTLTEEAVGPRFFMAPELEDGRVDSVTPKSDTYSLGKILYWLLSGGIVFSREKHREREFDLKQYNLDSELEWNNIYMEHVNRLLDLMITHDPEKRREVDSIRIFIKRTKRLVEEQFTPISPNIKQPCTYCGYGYYVMKAKGDLSVQNFGFVPIGAPDWRVLTCNRCGHVQSFRVDYAEEKEWWK
jgi:serine/threonine protein kinase